MRHNDALASAYANRVKVMDADERTTCLEALAAFAWADGAVDEKERKRIRVFLAETSALSSPEIEHLLSSVRELSAELLSRIKVLPADRVCELLAVADAMCHAEHPPTAGEVDLMQKIGITKFGEPNALRISSWLEHQRQANTLLDDLLDTVVEG